MKISLKNSIGILVLAAGVAVSGGAVLAGAPIFQDQGPDYSHNKAYQQGMRDGQSDHTHNRDHSKKRHFKKDDDQKAYEAGYQKGHGN
ncbi:MAG TPA: hypothetical protein VME17_12025 [Bryobacteraceae bacterium]|nr:hypothetical protein [Bryobacteraceae bacterium]